MLCHPKRIKKLPEFQRFKAIERKILETEHKRLTLKREQESETFTDKGVFVVPSACGKHCPYWTECQRELKRSKINKK